ncbi:MAG: hypothetical protein QGG46_01330, partial [Gammaproteobacteria bacterium]|nr:hypothetical protein [Gammaproteobacteria bacterium]
THRGVFCPLLFLGGGGVPPHTKKTFFLVFLFGFRPAPPRDKRKATSLCKQIKKSPRMWCIFWMMLEFKVAEKRLELH